MLCSPVSMELHSFLLLAIAFLLLSFAFFIQSATSRPHNNSTDLESLLAFKDHVEDSLGILSTNWTTDVPFCSWMGVSCNQAKQRVTAIGLGDVPLHGSIAPEIANISFLSSLDLANCSLTGPIPSELGRLSRIRYLILQQNSLLGPIPATIFNISSLVKLSVAFNNLSGSLPSNKSFILLPHLQAVSISGNHLTGEIPTSFVQCRELQVLSLSMNEFTGSIPTQFGNLPELTDLYLGGNQLTGTIPASLGNLTKLNKLEISQNNLSGAIPNELGNLLNLNYINLDSNRLTGPIPTALLNLSMLTDLELGGNDLTGTVPLTIGTAMPLLQVFQLAVNRLSGGLDFITSLSNCRDLRTLSIWNNELEGVLPNSVANLSTKLTRFDVSGNHIKGSIPAGLGNLTSLFLLGLQKNELTGVLPSDIARLQSIQEMYFDDNKISGSIPDELCRLVSLSGLNLGMNKLSGPIPSCLGNLTRIQRLMLPANRLSSSIPNSLWSLSGLIYLSLQRNFISGVLSPRVGNLKTLDHLDLSMNQFSGSVPSALGELQMLTYLDISSNSFGSQIPKSLGGLVNINQLNLSHNFLSGAIPNSLATLRHVSSLDLSFNQLDGQIPEGRAFSNVSIPSLKGNAALCGAPQLGFPACPAGVTSKARKGKSLLKYVLPAIASALLLMIIIYLLVRFRQKRKPQIPPQNGTSYHENLDNHPLITYHQLVRATDNFSQSNLLGKGGFSSVFKGCLDDGSTVAIKVLNLEVEGATASFETECQALSAVRHRNLVKVITICSNLDFKALILQYMPNGSLEKWLYSDDCCLNLLQRINIAVDVASALEHLHYGHSHVVMHRDLKPSNVLLDENFAAHVGDFGTAKLLLGDSRHIANTRTPGTIGYMAPEYGSSGAISIESDVYSFGILLLEIFFGRRPTDSMFCGELSLRKWVNKAHPSAVLEIIDCKLLQDDIFLKQQSEDRTAIQHCLISMINVGLQCSRVLPKERTLMKDVIPILQQIKKEYLVKFPCAEKKHRDSVV